MSSQKKNHRYGAPSPGLWHILIFLMSSASKIQEGKGITAKAISKNMTGFCTLKPKPSSLKKKKNPEYNPLHPGYFCNVSSLFFPGRLDVSESHVLQTTAWQKAVVAFAFCVCQFSAPLTRVTLLVRGSQQTVNSKTKPKKHLQKKNPTKFKCEIF